QPRATARYPSAASGDRRMATMAAPVARRLSIRSSHRLAFRRCGPPQRDRPRSCGARARSCLVRWRLRQHAALRPRPAPRRTIAAILPRLEAPLGCFAILGNHDYVYGARAVIDALEHHGFPVLDHARRSMRFENHAIDLVGVPDAGMTRGEAYALLTSLSAERPTIVLAHDPICFTHLPTGPHFMLAGHTHGGQIRLPGIGIIRTAANAPRRSHHGLVEERGQYLYVTSGIGTSGLPLRWGVPPEIVVLDTAGKRRT